MKITFIFFVFRDVPGCSGMFLVPGFIDASFYSCYDDWFFDCCPVEVNKYYHSRFVQSQQIFRHFLRLFIYMGPVCFY